MKAIWQTVLLLALSLFLAEAGIMLILELMDRFDLHVPAALLPWIDASLLVLLASPAIFYWVLRPQIASERAKSRMLLLMSHELRNPLNGVLGMIDVIGGETCEARVKDHLKIARSSALRLSERIDVLLHFAEGYDPGHRLRIESVQPLPVLQDEAQRSEAACAAKGLAFEFKGAPLAERRINTDLPALQRILHILLDNAIRYTRQGGVTLEVALGKRFGNSQMEFVVRDTGPGLGDVPRAALFRPFESGLVSHGREQDGLRLGLPMAKWLAEKLGGTLDVVNARDGSGTVATLSLPTT
jgi:signal transduction histidine kinase